MPSADMRMEVGAGPPFQNPPLVGDVGGAFGASLRAWMQGRAISGRRTQTPGRSPCFRTLPGLLFISSWCRQAWVTDMATYTNSRTTQATPEEVWRLWSDVSTWPRWNPDVLAVEIDGPFAAGAAGTMTTRAGGTHAIALESVDAGRSFELVTAALPATRFAFRCEVRPGAGGGSVISQALTMR